MLNGKRKRKREMKKINKISKTCYCIASVGMSMIAVGTFLAFTENIFGFRLMCFGIIPMSLGTLVGGMLE